MYVCLKKNKTIYYNMYIYIYVKMYVCMYE